MILKAKDLLKEYIAAALKESREGWLTWDKRAANPHFSNGIVHGLKSLFGFDDTEEAKKYAEDWIDYNDDDHYIDSDLEHDIKSYAAEIYPRLIRKFRGNKKKVQRALNRLLDIEFGDMLYEVAGDYSMSATRRAEAPGNIRAGFPTKGTRSSIQSDVESELSSERQYRDSLPKAAVVFITRNGKVLAVSRGSNMSNMNMPGGEVELGEEPIDAAARELKEETGLTAQEIFPIFTKVYNGRLVSAFKVPSYSGDLVSSHEGQTSWEDPEALLRSSYGDYFRDMLSSLHGDALSESLCVR